MDMAPRSKKAAVEPEVPEVDYSVYRDKPPTDLQERMADWVLDQFDVVAHDEDGGELELDEASFREGIRLGVAFRMIFQASPENQAVLAENKARRLAEEEDVKPTPKAKPARKTAKAAVVNEEAEEAEEEEDAEPEEAEEAPKATAKRRTAKAGTSGGAKAAKPATRRTTRGKTAAAPVAVGSDAPF